MKKTLTLCKPCAVKLGEIVDLAQLGREKDKKIVCDECGRRRFGAEYAMGKGTAKR